MHMYNYKCYVTFQNILSLNRCKYLFIKSKKWVLAKPLQIFGQKQNKCETSDTSVKNQNFTQMLDQVDIFIIDGDIQGMDVSGATSGLECPKINKKSVFTLRFVILMGTF